MCVACVARRARSLLLHSEGNNGLRQTGKEEKDHRDRKREKDIRVDLHEQGLVEFS